MAESIRKVTMLDLSDHKDLSLLKTQFKQLAEWLIKNGFAFYTETPDEFPAIDLTWKSPRIITNSVVEVDTQLAYDYTNVIKELEFLGCQAIQIRILEKIKENEFDKLINTFRISSFTHIELILPFSQQLKLNQLDTLFKRELRINRIILFAAPRDDFFVRKILNYTRIVVFSTKDIRINKSERIRIGMFNASLPLFAEAQRYNAGLNQKVCIDRHGNIKNYFTHSKVFGNVNLDKIKNVVSKNNFRKKWYISNDMIKTCKMCQYRYSCVSNSDLRKVPGGEYEKMSMCNFDPLQTPEDRG